MNDPKPSTSEKPQPLSDQLINEIDGELEEIDGLVSSIQAATNRLIEPEPNGGAGDDTCRQEPGAFLGYLGARIERLREQRRRLESIGRQFERAV